MTHRSAPFERQFGETRHDRIQHRAMSLFQLNDGQDGSAMATSPLIHSTAWVAPGAVLVGKVELCPESSVWFNAVCGRQLST